VSDIQLSPGLATTLPPGQLHAALRQAANEVVGTVFYAPMLKMARENPFKGKYGHGGRGEEVFGAQLDMELARRASHRLDGGLADAIVRRFEREAQDA
jgi:Rod binding domain-containing protein